MLKRTGVLRRTAPNLRHAALLAVVLGGGYVVGRSIEGGDAGAELGSTSTARSLELVQVADHGPIDGHAHAMAWDADGRLWYVLAHGSQSVELAMVAPDGTRAAWALPFESVPTPHTYVGFAGALVWVGTGYNVAAFEPSSQAFVVSVEFDVQSEYGDHDALSRGAPLPGTWINGLVADSNGAIRFTRNNVMAVFTIDREGRISASGLEQSPSGLRMDSDGAVPFVESGDQVMLLDSSGREGRLANMAAHAWSEECEIGVDGQGVIWLAGERPARAIEPGPRVLLSSLASANGVYAALGLVAEAAALLVNCESGEVERYELGGSMVQPIGGPPDLGPVSRTNHPEAVAIDDSGNLAISVDDGRIYIVNR